MYLDMQLTMGSPMEPVIYKIHSNKTNVPGPWGIPRQSHQMKIIINKNVQSKLSTQHNYPEKKKHHQCYIRIKKGRKLTTRTHKLECKNVHTLTFPGCN